MLKQNFEPQDSSISEQPAGKMRVKKEEFARAIAALEARRQSEAQAKEGTVVIGDVLQQLQIDLPAEEVLREIEGLHSGQPREEAMRRPFWNAHRKSAAALITSLFLVPVVAVGVAVLILNPLRSPQQAVSSSNLLSSNFPSNTYLIGTYPPGMITQIHLPPGMTPELMDEGGFNASSVLKPLSAVPDNQPVHCTTASFAQLCMAYLKEYKPRGFLSPVGGLDPGKLDPTVLARSNQLFDVRPQLKKPWILIKHNGRLYLRAWVAAQFNEAEARGQGVVLHNSPRTFEVGVQPHQITLPLSFSIYYGLEGRFGRNTPNMEIGNVSMDSHAWEKW